MDGTELFEIVDLRTNGIVTVTDGRTAEYHIVPEITSTLRRWLFFGGQPGSATRDDPNQNTEPERMNGTKETGINFSKQTESWEKGTILSLFDHEFYSLIQ